MITPKTLQILHEVHDVLPNATVAGGFLRDEVLGVPYRDIDIAVPYDCHDLVGLGFTYLSAEMDDKDYQHDKIKAVWSRGEWNVIEYADNTDTTAMNTYIDIGLCKISWNFHEGLVMHPGFIKDMMDQTLTVYRTGWGEEGVEKHLARLKEKFPSYNVVREVTANSAFDWFG